MLFVLKLLIFLMFAGFKFSFHTSGSNHVGQQQGDSQVGFEPVHFQCFSRFHALCLECVNQPKWNLSVTRWLAVVDVVVSKSYNLLHCLNLVLRSHFIVFWLLVELQKRWKVIFFHVQYCMFLEKVGPNKRCAFKKNSFEEGSYHIVT